MCAHVIRPLFLGFDLVSKMMNMDKVLSSYYTLGTRALDIASTTSLNDAHDVLRWFLLDMPVAPGLLSFHCLFAAERVHALTGGRQFWFKSFVLTLFAAFGGSTLAAVLSGSPAPLFTTASNTMFGYITLAWYLMDQSRFARLLLRTRPFNALLAFGASAAKARTIFSFIDIFTENFPGAVAGAIALGGLCGSGGLLFISLEKKARRGFHTPSEISEPGWGFKSAYLVAALYYIATDPKGVLLRSQVPITYSIARDSARYALSLGLCCHAALETILARHVNPVYLVEKFLYALTRVRSEPLPPPAATDLVAEASAAALSTKAGTSSTRPKKSKKSSSHNSRQNSSAPMKHGTKQE